MKHTRLSKDELLYMLRHGSIMSLSQKVHLVLALSLPAILAQLTNIIMQYIDASMVGSLGAEASASIGLVSTTIWLFGGVCSSFTVGFYVQVAHRIGANDECDARRILRQAFLTTLLFGLFMSSIGLAISPYLPQWLGGDESICTDASLYFRIYSIALPFIIINRLASGMLRSSGNVKIPSMLNINMCVLDVIFNFFFILPSRSVSLFGIDFFVPGLGYGVMGAAYGTFVAELVTVTLMVYYLCFKSKELRLNQDTSGSFRPTWPVLRKALTISLPMGIEHFVICAAQIMGTVIVAPLGTAAIAANSFGITIESLCYMPGYGIADAATTLVGQSLGAKRLDLMQGFANITIIMGMAMMTFMGVVMYIWAPELMSVMTPDTTVQLLSTEALRIEAFAEPMFAASIVVYAIFVGAGDTKIPCLMNFLSIWMVRITLASVMAKTMGLNGVWLAMCLELCFRGAIFLIRYFYVMQHKESYLKKFY